MGGAPSFSVIVCNYNDARYLQGAVERIFGQVRPPDQVIVVDDGSDDESRVILRSLARRYPDIVLVCHETNRGVVQAGLSGLAVASGDYVAWWSVDDRVSPDLLAAVERAAVAFPQAGVIAAEADVARETSCGLVPLYTHRFGLASSARFVSPDEIVRIHRERYLWLSSSGAFLRRDALLAIGGWDRNLDWFADWFALYSIAYRQGAALIGLPLSQVVQRSGSYGARRRADPRHVRPVVERFLDLLRSGEFAEFRRSLTAGTIGLSYALGRRLVPVVLHRPGDWGLGAKTALAYLRHRLVRRATNDPRGIDALLDQSGFSEERIRCASRHS